MLGDTSYFTREEFRTFAKDKTNPLKYDDSDIDRAQMEVVERIEAWSRSAFPNVTGTVGDGEADVARENEEWFHGGKNLYTLMYTPILEVSVWESAGTPLTDGVDAYMHLPEGQFEFAQAPMDGINVVHIVYTYGHTECPWSVKRPAMRAARTLLDMEEQRGEIPANVVSYTTQSTTFNFMRGDTSEWPFPWDADASEALAKFWWPQRATFFSTV